MLEAEVLGGVGGPLLEGDHLQAGGRQLLGDDAARRTEADDDRVGVVVHGRAPIRIEPPCSARRSASVFTGIDVASKPGAICPVE